MEAIIVGDLHGNLNFYRKVKSQTQDKIILVGDLIDSRHFTRAEQLTLLQEVLDDIEAGKTECLLGNHELSYLIPRMRGTGYASSFDAQIMPLKSRMWKLMKPYIFDIENSVLITHAGLSHNLIAEAHAMDGFIWYSNEELETFLEVSWRSQSSYVYHIGTARGGPDTCGGIFWCDWNLEFSSVPGLIQIFGHTPVKKIETQGTNWNLDCVERGINETVVKLKDKQVEIISYEEIQDASTGGSQGSSGTEGQTNPAGTTKEIKYFRVPSTKRKIAPSATNSSSSGQEG
jgi:hypothetical protein